MRDQLGFFDVDDRLKRLSDLGDRLEAFRAAVDFELFRAELNVALGYSNGSEGGDRRRSGDDVQDPCYPGDRRSLRRTRRVPHQ